MELRSTLAGGGAQAQKEAGVTAQSEVSARLARGFLHARTLVGGAAAAPSLDSARLAHASMVRAQPRGSTLNAAWQAVGPGQVESPAYGKISGRVSSITIDPADPSGNTVYLGTTGGGVWKSVNAAGDAESVTFVPLTDNLPVFSGNAGSAATASLSIGAISAQIGGILLAGTGDPNDALDSYYGSGILRSTDAGLSWTLIRNSQDGATGLHYFVGLGFAGFAWSTVNPSLVVAALSQSAEGTIVNAPTKNSVMGLYASGDAGETWQMATISDGPQPVQTPLPTGANAGGLAATAVVWNPVRQRFYAVVRYHGYYESADGLSWTRLNNQPGAAMSLEACPSSPTTSGSTSCPVFRGVLAVNPDTGDTFALTADRHNIDQGLWRDVCGLTGGRCSSPVVSFGSRLASSALEAGSGSAVIPQADYNLSLAAISAGRDTLIFAGTGDLYRCSLAQGCVFRNTTHSTDACGAPAMVGPAQHAIATLGTPSLLFLGNDSGLWRSTDAVNQQKSLCSSDDATHFQNLNGGLGSLAEVISFAQDPEDPLGLLVGLGASGTASSGGTAASAWQQMSGGEGGTVAIDQTDPLLRYISTAAGVSLRTCSRGNRCTAADFAGPATIGAAQTSTDASVLDAPWILDPAASENLLVGTCRVWRGPAASGNLWSQANRLSTTFGGPQNSSCDPLTNSLVRSVAGGGPLVHAGTQQNSGSRVLYAGMAGAFSGGGAIAGHLFTNGAADVASGSTRWIDAAMSPVTNDATNGGVFNRGGFDISSIAVDPHDTTGKTVYATVMGFSGNVSFSPHVYGSTDGGGHWLNLSSNLPNAPANSVVVDPNDANTIYVGMDTGVYVTTQVTTCTTANCWSVFGVSLPNAPVTQISAAARMATGDGRMGMLRAGTYGRGIWQIPLLTASAAAQPAISLSTASLSFGDQEVGTVGLPQPITVTNTGVAPLAVSRVAITGDFNAADTCAGAVVPVNGSCVLQVQFLPSVEGPRTGVLTIYANVHGGQATAMLSGVGTAPGSVVLNPYALIFPSITINGTSAAQNITITNVGASTATIQSPSISGDFRLTANTCGSSLTAGTGCTVSIVFSPVANGTRNGSFTVAGSSGTQTASLTGTSTLSSTDSISPGSLTFGPQQLGSSSAIQQIVVTNAGDVPLTLLSARVSSGDFIAVNGCGNSLNAHSACSINVMYAPRNVGAAAGVLLIADQFRSQEVGLTGTGAAPPGVSLAPSASMTFPATAVGMQSPGQTVTVTNNGGLTLALESASLSGDFAFTPGGSCGTSLSPASACTLQIAFVPIAGGTRSGALVLQDSSPTSPHTLALTGAGIDFTLTASGSTSLTIVSGKSATYPLLLSAAGGTTSGSAVLSCTGAPVNATCVVSPGSAPLGPSMLVTVTVGTGIGSTALQAPGPLPNHKPSSIVLAGVLPFGFLILRRKRIARMTGMLALICIVVAGGGCGSGRLIPGSADGSAATSTVTPAGTYKLTVTATSSGLTRTMSLDLMVQ